MSETSTETITVESSNGESSNGDGSAALRKESAAFKRSEPARRKTTVVQSRGAGPAIKTPLGTAPIIPLLMIGFGAYLLWFMSKYWRGSGPAVWPSYPIKSVLQGKGIPPPQPAPPSSMQVATVEAAAAQAAAPSQSTTPPGPPRGGPGGQGGPTPPQNASQAMIIRAVLAALGAPQNTANINSMVAWQRHEAPWNGSPPDGAEFTHNPWNTTLAAGSSGTVPGTPGVRIYPDWAAGIAATVATLRGGYAGIIAALRSGRGLCGGGLAGDFSTWSGGGYSSVC